MSNIPEPIQRLISEVGGVSAPGRILAERATCAGAKFHSPTPLTVREVAIGDDAVYLCGTCHDNLLVFMDLMKAMEGNMPWETRRCFGNLLRAVGMRLYASQGEVSGV